MDNLYLQTVPLDTLLNHIACGVVITSEILETVITRFEATAKEIDHLKKELASTRRELELVSEQDDFKLDLLESVKELAERNTHARFKETKELACDILHAFNESYVEM